MSETPEKPDVPVDQLAALAAQIKQLNLGTHIFADPETAARKELETGEPILATYSFLKWLTDQMVRPGDFSWMDRAIANQEHNATLNQKHDATLAATVQRVLEAGTDRNDLNTLVRVMQFKICDHICFMLDQCAMEGYVPIQDFAVYHVGGGDSPTTDRPLAKLTALHELIGIWDPDYGVLKE